MAYYLTPAELERDSERIQGMKQSVNRCDLLLGHMNNLIDRLEEKQQQNGETVADERPALRLEA